MSAEREEYLQLKQQQQRGVLTEQERQGITQLPWHSEYVKEYGESPDLDTPEYDYARAWRQGLRPSLSTEDQRQHWPSYDTLGQDLKAGTHPTYGAGTIQEMSPERQEYLRLKSEQGTVDTPSTTLGDLRFEPPTMPAATTYAPPDPSREIRGSLQPEIQEREFGVGENLKAMGLGVVGGALDVDPAGGSILSRAVREYHGAPAYQVGEMAGLVAPYTGAAKVVSGVSKAPRIARVAAKLPGLVRAGVRGAGVGATAAGLRETSRAIQGREADFGEIGKEAALFGAADIVLRGGGRVAKKLLKVKAPVKPVTEAVKPKGVVSKPTKVAKKPWEMTKQEFEQNLPRWKVVDEKIRRGQVPDKWWIRKAGKKEAIKSEYHTPEQIGFGLDYPFSHPKYHETSVRIAIQQGKIKYHPDYSNLAKKAPRAKVKAPIVEAVKAKPVEVAKESWEGKYTRIISDRELQYLKEKGELPSAHTGFSRIINPDKVSAQKGIGETKHHLVVFDDAITKLIEQRRPFGVGEGLTQTQIRGTIPKEYVGEVLENWSKKPPQKPIMLGEKGKVVPKKEVLKPKVPVEPVVELVKTKKAPPLSEIETYYKSIAAPQKLTVEQAKSKGIALRQTKGGKIVPAVRRAGVYVPEEFAHYKKFKDARAGILGGTKDPTRMIQEIDGALSVAKKAALPGQAGPTEKYVLWRTRDISKMKMNWRGEQEQKLKGMFKGISDKDAEIANSVLEKISRKGAYVDPEKLALFGPVSQITKDVKIVRFAQEARKYFEHLLKEQNNMRGLRNQSPIPHRDYYTPHEIQRSSLWGEAFGIKKTPIEIMKKPALPDYIKPNKPFNPRELAREANLPEYMRQMNLKRLLERYTETAAKDIYNTSIIQNNKAFAQQLETMGYPNAARFIQDWTAEAYAGIRPSIDRAVFGQAGKAGRILEKGMRRFRRALVRGVFPLNISWNLFVQTSSGVMTGTRYGLRSSTKGLYDWLTKPALREDIRKNAYSFVVKTLRSGKITEQDINQGLSRAVKVERGSLQKTADAFNYFTEWTERHLTGWSIASARRHGIKKGLKGKALWEYASDGGAKTQSMYNLEDLPGVLRNEAVKTPFPFQTFSFEVFNSMREFAGRIGTPPSTSGERIKWVLRFVAGASAVNYVGKTAIGREPWEAKSFIPFYNLLEAIPAAIKGENLGRATARGQPAPAAAATQFAQGIKAYIKNGDSSKLRRASIKYLPGLVGIPGGLQASRIVDGIIAISDGGMRDSAGRMMFPITEAKDKGRALFSGPWSTTGGQEYWKKREKSWLDVFEKKEIKQPKPKKEKRQSRQRPAARR